jgi:hypothetical protein
MLIPITLFSQIKITGKIVNQKNEVLEPIEVLILNKDSTAIKSELTNIKGEFSLWTEKGEYFFQVRQMGTILYKQKININQNLNLGIIKITEKEQKLVEVVITSQKKLIERKVDRLVFNVDNSLAASGGDAIDALMVTPGLRVQNDQITMIGKSGMAIMVDDRLIQLSGEDLINFLKTIPSDNIKSIEVINAPPAKYDAEGNSGIVNIKLKKAKNNSWNTTINSSYKQNTYATGSFGGNLNYQKNKLSFVSSINHVEGSLKRTEKDEIYYPIQTWITDFNKRIYTKSLSSKIGLDYKITNKWTLGILYLGSTSSPKIKERDLGLITNNTTQQLDSIINTKARNTRNNFTNSYNIYNKIELDTLGGVLTTDFDFFTWKNTDNRNFSTQNLYNNYTSTRNGFISAINIGMQDIKNYSAKIDVFIPLKWLNLSYGGKVSFIKTNNNLIFFDTTTGTTILNLNKSDIFNFNENTQALYISGNKKFGKDKWETQIGLRMENTQTKGFSETINRTDSKNYTEFFPTIYIVYNPSEKHSFSLDYGKRIQRPGYKRLNPFKYYSSPYNYTTGNPFLLPQFSHNLQFKHNYKDFISASLTYTKEIQGYGEISFIDTNMQYFNQLNYFTNNNFQLSESYTYNKFPQWESNNQVDGYYSKVKFSNNINLDDVKSWGLYFSTNNTFILNKSKTIKAGVNFRYHAPEYDLQNKNKGYSSLDLALRFSFLQKSLLLNINAQDILKTDKSYKTTYTSNIKQIYSHYGDSRFFRISLAYKFGSEKLNLENRYFGNEEEKGRANN